MTTAAGARGGRYSAGDSSTGGPRDHQAEACVCVRRGSTCRLPPVAQPSGRALPQVLVERDSWRPCPVEGAVCRTAATGQGRAAGWLRLIMAMSWAFLDHVGSGDRPPAGLGGFDELNTVARATAGLPAPRVPDPRCERGPPRRPSRDHRDGMTSALLPAPIHRFRALLVHHRLADAQVPRASRAGKAPTTCLAPVAAPSRCHVTTRTPASRRQEWCSMLARTTPGKHLREA